MRDGEEYELFVKNIYEKIIKSNKIDNIKVEHNILLKGTTCLKHQVDLYWEFKNLGITHRVVDSLDGLLNILKK